MRREGIRGRPQGCATRAARTPCAEPGLPRRPAPGMGARWVWAPPGPPEWVHAIPGAHGASPRCRSAGWGGGRTALAPHLQDSDVPGEALQRFLQLASPQPLLGLDAVQFLVEVHACADGSVAQWAQGHLHEDGRCPHGQGLRQRCPSPGMGMHAGWAPRCPSSPKPTPCWERWADGATTTPASRSVQPLVVLGPGGCGVRKGSQYPRQRHGSCTP